MLAESISVLAITLCMVVIFVRSGHKEYAASLVPLLIVPGGNIFIWLAMRMLVKIIPSIPVEICSSFSIIAALAASCLLVFFFSGKIKSSRNKKIYIVLLSGYNVILTCAFVFQIMLPLMA